MPLIRIIPCSMRMKRPCNSLTLSHNGALSVISYPLAKNFRKKKNFRKIFGYIDLTRLRTRKPSLVKLKC